MLDERAAAFILHPSSFILHRSVRRQQRPLTGIPRELLQRIGEMFTVMQQEDTTGSARHQEGKERGVGLGGVARAAGEDQIVRAIIGRLAAAGPNMIEGDGLHWHARATIGTDRAVLLEEPFTVRTVGAAGGSTEARTAGSAAAAGGGTAIGHFGLGGGA